MKKTIYHIASLCKDKSIAFAKTIRDQITNWSKYFLNISSGKFDDQTENEPPIRKVVIFGVIVLLSFFGGFMLWSLLVPLESAAVASGKIIVASNRKTIQHLEGGIIKKIYVKDGSRVKAGQPLLKLDDTQSKATYDLLYNQANELLAEEARLVAERDENDRIQFPEVLLEQRNDPKAQNIIQVQQSLFESNHKTLSGQLGILQKRIDQLNKQIEAKRAQVDANDVQLKYINEELKAVRILAKKELIEKTRLWSLEREAARLSGNRGELLGSIAQIEQKIGETEKEIITLKDTDHKETLKDLRETRSKLTDVLEREKAAKDILNRTVILAPQDGVVVGLKEHTIGGVLMPGKPILDIVPKNDELIIEARINPLDIDVVHPGMDARVQLTAYPQYKTPKLDGTVVHVSADSFQDDATGVQYYKIRVIIPPATLKRLKNINLYPGMPVSVMIIKEKRTPFDYFITPLRESFHHAFREQ